jgi:mRNA interferase RelE/StbE
LTVFSVVIHKKLVKTLENLPARHLEQFAKLIETLSKNPYPWKDFDLKKVEGTDNTCRIRFGTYRVIYYIEKETKTIHILKFDLRKKIFR